MRLHQDNTSAQSALRQTRRRQQLRRFSGVIVEAEEKQREANPAPKGQQKRGRDETRNARRSKRICRRSFSQDEKQQRLDSIANTALNISKLAPETLKVMRDGQGFSSDPRLGLLYFHCCGQHPDAFVFNDETLAPDENGNETETTQRLLKVVEDPPGRVEASRCQQSAKEMDGGSLDIFVCASCCELILDRRQKIVETSVDQLPESFRATPKEREERYGGIDDTTRQNHCQVFQNGEELVYINPDLVVDNNLVVLCVPCSINPRQVPFSIANGHDYGRRGQLPVLNEIATNCISPVRRFGLEVSLSAKHMSGHVICFASDGPEQCTRSLPNVELESMPRVTFVGPREQWRLAKRKFGKLFDLPEDDIYRWLSVLSQTHHYWRREGISIDDSCHRRAALRELEKQTLQNVVISSSSTTEQLVDAARTEPLVREGDRDIIICDGNDIATHDVIQEKAAVLKATPANTELHQNGMINAVLEMLPDMHQHQNKSPSENVESGTTTRLGNTVSALDDENDLSCNANNVFAVSRAMDPVVEWDSNGHLLAGAFPTLFLRGGDMLPKGSMPKALIAHLLRYYDGRFEQNVMFVATLFNQRQRHAAVQKAARAGTTHSTALLKLGRLANNPDFRKRLQDARENPTAKATKQLNAQLLRVLSIVGEKVPFSPFELAAARPRLAALSQRYGLAHHWITLVPPEQDDLRLLRIAQIRKQKAWNRSDNIFFRGSCQWNDLPQDLQQSARKRLAISAMYPALAAKSFADRFTSTQRDILRCESTHATRISHDYDQLESGAYGKVRAFGAVVEPQRGGRLHAHMTTYGLTWSPELLTRIVISPKLCEKARLWLDSVSRTYLSSRMHEYMHEHQASNPIDLWTATLPRPCQITVPSAETHFEAFQQAAERCMAATNIHQHSSTCMKGPRGRYMCRLNRPAITRSDPTAPVQLVMNERADLRNGIRGHVTTCSISESSLKTIDAGYDTDKGDLLRPHLNFPIAWEQYRPAEDALVVETNMVLSALTASHTNSSVLATEDAGEFVDHYQQNYMVKDSGGLKSALSAVLTAIEESEKHPSTAEDSDTPLRQAKYLATRTVNAFAGGHEWPLSLMVYALLGYNSYISSDVFWFVFPHDYVNFVINKRNQHTTPDLTVGAETSVDNELEQLVEVLERDETNQSAGISADTADHDGTVGPKSGGARMFDVEGRLVFLTQAVSYAHRGKNFEGYAPIEFESIVDIRRCKPQRQSNDEQPTQGRPRRKAFPFAADHPLYPHYEGCVRTKMKTPMLGGPPLPTYNTARKSEAKMDLLAKAIICTFVPWDLSTGLPPFELNEMGLRTLCKRWDRHDATLINRQRYRSIANLLKRGHRDDNAGRVYSQWRAQNADHWNDISPQTPAATETAIVGEELTDPEAFGILPSNEDIFELLRQTTEHRPDIQNTIRSLHERFWKMIPEYIVRDVFDQSTNIRHYKTAVSDTIYFGSERLGRNECNEVCPNSSGVIRLTDIAKSIKGLTKKTPETVISQEKPHGQEGYVDPLSGVESAPNFISPTTVTHSQHKIIQHVVTEVAALAHGSRKQSLTMIHGSGGTGKSFVIRRIQAELESRGIRVINTCPTGAGACLLPGGQTIHAAFKFSKANKQPLSPAKLEALKLIFDESVGLVVIDEVSMVTTELFAQIDERLRALYDPSKIFGAMSILLVGDFLQLDPVKGTSLCKNMYVKPRNDFSVKARDLFSRFRVFFLREQIRAAECAQQQQILSAFQQLPDYYPQGTQWNEENGRGYYPISRNALSCLEKSLTTADIKGDPSWLQDFRILVTGNIDRAALTQAAVLLFGHINNTLVVRWRRKIKEDIPEAVSTVLYDESMHPYLFSYFAKNAPAQVLDNAAGNVNCGIANGTECKMHSLGWDDYEKANTANKLIAAATRNNANIVDLPWPPDFINIVLTDTNGDDIPGKFWPHELNLETEWVTHEDGSCIKPRIVIPIGLSPTTDSKVKYSHISSELKSKPPHYIQHAVDLAFVRTVWKAQGATLRRIMLLLQGTSTAPAWGFEHLYVGISRVKTIRGLRSLPSTPSFSRIKILQLRPCIFTVKWRMSIDDKGYWHSREQDE